MLLCFFIKVQIPHIHTCTYSVWIPSWPVSSANIQPSGCRYYLLSLSSDSTRGMEVASRASHATVHGLLLSNISSHHVNCTLNIVCLHKHVTCWTDNKLNFRRMTHLQQRLKQNLNLHQLFSVHISNDHENKNTGLSDDEYNRVNCLSVRFSDGAIRSS